MNEWLDRGLFCVTWVGFMWIIDALTTGSGIISFGALMIGAIVLVVIGLFHQYASVVKR